MIKSASELVLEQLPDNVNFSLLKGENLIVCARNVTHVCPVDGPILGTLYVTNYKLLFENGETFEKKNLKLDWKGNGYFKSFSQIPGPEIPLGTIVKVEKIGRQTKKKENSYGIEIFCSDFRNHRFTFVPENHSRRGVYDAVMTYAFPLSSSLEFFAFNYQEQFSVNGWELYNPTEELKRLIQNSTEWRITNKNSNYELCPTYPAVFAVPTLMKENDLEEVAKFRTKNRLPVLSWFHKKNGVSISRCSQPKVGLGRRSELDEFLIGAIRTSTQGSKTLYIVDARPKVNAVANQAKGAGYENTEIYENTELLFMNIPNIHVIRESYRKLRDCCFPASDDPKWYSKAEDTRWLEYIKLILQTTAKIVELVDKQGSSVLVHCSDGWDRTPQLTSLASLLLDPFYRTIKGFCILIEKEWISFGHKFSERVGHGDKNYGDEQRAPIFIQFLDCVYQLWTQFPCSFEFNIKYLICLADEVYICRYGTFLYDSESLKREKKIKEKTPSLWSYILSNIDEFTNPLYEAGEEVLYANTTSKKLLIWNDYYMRWNPTAKKYDPKNEVTKELGIPIEVKSEIDIILDETETETETENETIGAPSEQTGTETPKDTPPETPTESLNEKDEKSDERSDETPSNEPPKEISNETLQETPIQTPIETQETPN